MQKLETSTLMQTFLYSIKSKETQKQYQTTIGYFEKWNQNKKIQDLLKLDTKAIEDLLIQYIISMRDKRLSYGSINNRLASVASFLSLNDVMVNKKKLNRFMGEHDKTIKDEAYSHEDLQKMFQYASFRTKLLVSIYSSTGIRKGAIIDLKLKHLEKIENLYKFTIYENSIKSEYRTFCTPECASMIDEYLTKRKAAGEKITPESYLIRNEFDFVSKPKVKSEKKMTISALNEVMNKMLVECELRKVHHNNHPTETELSDSNDNSNDNNSYQRHSKALYHAFRKYFETCLINCEVSVIITKMLLGQSTGLEESYYRPTEKQILLNILKPSMS